MHGSRLYRCMIVSAFVLGALAVTGCGSSSSSTSSSSASTSTASPSSTAGKVNTTEVEQGIEKSLSTAAVKVTSASCPSGIPSKVGQTFTCSVKLSNSASGEVVVTQTGPNSFAYQFKDGTMQIPGSSADASIEKQLAAQGAKNAVVNSPSTIIIKVGTTVTSALSVGNANGSVTYSFSSANGTVDPSSVKQTP